MYKNKSIGFPDDILFYSPLIGVILELSYFVYTDIYHSSQLIFSVYFRMKNNVAYKFPPTFPAPIRQA